MSSESVQIDLILRGAADVSVLADASRARDGVIEEDVVKTERQLKIIVTKLHEYDSTFLCWWSFRFLNCVKVKRIVWCYHDCAISLWL